MTFVADRSSKLAALYCRAGQPRTDFSASTFNSAFLEYEQ